MSSRTDINLHIERVVIDEAVHRAGPEAVRTALESQLPALLAAGGVRQDFQSAATEFADRIASRVQSSAAPLKP
jgi:hypothetical protein